MMTTEQRYLHDPVFKRLVDTIEVWIREHMATPTEVRDAAMLAALHYEMTTIRRQFIPPVDEAKP